MTVSTTVSQRAPAHHGTRREPEGRASAALLRYLRRNPSLGDRLAPSSCAASLLVHRAASSSILDEPGPSRSRRSSRRPGSCPSAATSRDATCFAVMVTGTPLTLRIGLIAGFIGVGLGAMLGFVAPTTAAGSTACIRGIVDVGLTIPGLMVLIVIAMMVPAGLSVNQMALVVASLAWLYPARTIRAQVLTHPRAELRPGRAAVRHGPRGDLQGDTAQPAALPRRLAGRRRLRRGAGVDRPRGARPRPDGRADDRHDLFWVNYNAAVINGWWWWWLPPIVVIGMLFVSLFLIAVGLDEVANPRVRSRA